MRRKCRWRRFDFDPRISGKLVSTCDRADAIRQPGGEQAVQLKVAQQAVEAFAQLAQKNNTMIIPASLSEVSGLIASAMSLSRSSATRPG